MYSTPGKEVEDCELVIRRKDVSVVAGNKMDRTRVDDMVMVVEGVKRPGVVVETTTRIATVFGTMVRAGQVLTVLVDVEYIVGIDLDGVTVIRLVKNWVEVRDACVMVETTCFCCIGDTPGITWLPNAASRSSNFR